MAPRVGGFHIFQVPEGVVGSLCPPPLRMVILASAARFSALICSAMGSLLVISIHADFVWCVIAFHPGVLKGVELLDTNADAMMASI